MPSSPSASSPASSDTSSLSGASHYENPGDFDLVEGWGPANRVPDRYKNLALEPTFRVEWLEMMRNMDSPFAKNHTVTVVDFQNPVFDTNMNKPVYGARISMDPSPTNFNADSNSTWVPGRDYLPGQFSIRLLRHSPTMAHRTKRWRTFPLRPGTTLAGINDFVYGRNMHKFIFLPYYGKKWKGCGDFILQLWGELVRNELVRSESKETLESAFCMDMRVTVLPNDAEMTTSIGRGFWIGWDPADDKLTPGHVYDDVEPDPPGPSDV